MAIDTAAKRNSAIATRRLPWFRRFAPLPDGSVTQADRQQDGLFYIGIAASVPSLIPLFNFTVYGALTTFEVDGALTTFEVDGQ